MTYRGVKARRKGPWRTLEAAEFATLTWVDWFNTRRLLGPLGDIPPAEFEAQYYAQAAVAGFNESGLRRTRYDSMRRSHSSETDSKAPAPERVLLRLGSLLDVLSGRRTTNAWIPRSRIEQASRLRSRTLSDWSWLWRKPCRYIRLWRAGRDLTNQRREAHNRLLLSRSASDPALADLNEAQRRAVVNLDDRVFVTAGAGSGKTTVITEKVRHVVRQGAARPDEIAVITFTNKATKEVRNRLRDIDGVAIETIHGLAMQVIERQGLGWPQLSPLAQDQTTHRRLTLISRALDETLAEKPEMFLEVYERGGGLSPAPGIGQRRTAATGSSRRHGGPVPRRSQNRADPICLRRRLPIRERACRSRATSHSRRETLPPRLLHSGRS